MEFLTDWLTDWLKELLVGGIMDNLGGLFDSVNNQVGEIATQVGTQCQQLKRNWQRSFFFFLKNFLIFGIFTDVSVNFGSNFLQKVCRFGQRPRS